MEDSKYEGIYWREKLKTKIMVVRESKDKPPAIDYYSYSKFEVTGRTPKEI